MNNRGAVTGTGIGSLVGLDAHTAWANLLGGRPRIAQLASSDTNGFETTVGAEVTDFDPPCKTLCLNGH